MSEKPRENHSKPVHGIAGHVVSINDMKAFVLMFTHLKAGLDRAVKATGIPMRPARTAIEHLWGGKSGPLEKGELERLISQIVSGDKNNDAHRLKDAAEAALLALQPVLEQRANSDRVRVAGGEAALMILLPQVLRASRILEGITLDLHRMANHRQRYEAVASRTVDFAIGPSPMKDDVVDGIEHVELFRAEYGLLYRTIEHPVPLTEIPDSFQDKTIFIVRPKLAPEFKMQEIVTEMMCQSFGTDYRPKFSHVDNALYTPPLVRATGHIGLFYHRPEWLREGLLDGLSTLPLNSSSGTFHLYRPKHGVSRDAQELMEIIINHCRVDDYHI